MAAVWDGFNSASITANNPTCHLIVSQRRVGSPFPRPEPLDGSARDGFGG
jgi:hypothetical protein